MLKVYKYWNLSVELHSFYFNAFKMSSTIFLVSGNLSFLGGPFLIPDQTKVLGASSLFETDISNELRRGAPFGFRIKDNSLSVTSLHNSSKNARARLLYTDQDLQASIKMKPISFSAAVPPLLDLEGDGFSIFCFLAGV